MTTIAHGQILIDVEDREAIAALRRVDGEFDRTMHKIDHERATATADIDTSKLDQGVKNAKRRIRELEREKAELPIHGNTKELDAAISSARRKLKRLDGERATMELKVKGQDEILKAEAKTRESIRKTEKALEDLNKRRLASVQAESRRRASLNRQREQEFKTSERAAYSEETSRNRIADALKKEQAAIPKLKSEYVKLLRQVEGFDAARRKAGRSGDGHAVLQVEVDHEKALAQMRAVREELERVGSPIEIEADVHPGRKFGEKMRLALLSGGVSGGIAEAGRSAGDKFVGGFRKRASRLNKSDIKSDLLQGAGVLASKAFVKVGQLAEGISRATVRIGPFTATIKQALVGLAAFGPIVVDLVGALGPLIGVVGSAAAGLGALSVGFLGGAIPSALGFLAVLKPVTSQFISAFKASKAYNDALLKGNTDLAAKKLKEMHSVLGNVDAATRKNFETAGRLNKRWTDLTAPSRKSAFKVIGESIGLADKSMDRFGKNINQGFDIAQKSVSRWIKGIGSKEGQNILGNMMDNFNKTLGPLLDGLGNIGTALGRIGSIASGFLPDLANQFKDWTQGLADSAGKTDSMRDRVKGWLDSLKSVGKFLSSAAGLITTFFSAGVGEGRSFVDTMTKAMDRWNALLKTPDGKRGLQDFFHNAVAGTQALFSALAPIASTFVGWATALSPFVAALLQGVGAVGSLVHAVLRLTVLRGPLTALAATFGALWAVGKIATAVQLVGNFTRALLGLRTAAAAAGATGVIAQLATMGAGGVGGAKGAANASKLAGGLNAVGGAATLAGARVTASGAAAAKSTSVFARFGTVAATVGGAVAAFAADMALPIVAAAALGYGINKLVMGMVRGGEEAKHLNSQLSLTNEALTKASGAASRSLGRSSRPDSGTGAAPYREITRAALDLVDAKKRVRDMDAQGLHGTADYTRALLDQADASDRVKSALTARTKDANKAVNDQKKYIENLKKTYAADPEAAKNTERELGLLAAANKKLNAALNQQSGTLVNNQRRMKGLGEYSKKATADVGKFTRDFNKATSGKAKNLVVNAKTEQAGAKVAKLGNDLAKTGNKKTAVKIVANSKNADQAISRLSRAKKIQQVVQIVTQGGPKALALMRSLVGAKLAPKVLRIIGSDASAKAKMAALRALGLPAKTLKILGDISHAMAAKRRAEAQRMKTLLQGIERRVTNPGYTGPPVAPITQAVRRKFSGSGAGGAAGSGPADGGTLGGGSASIATSNASPEYRRLLRAHDEAGRRPVRDMRSGGKVNRPTMVTGEENRTEFVIPTNPRYKDRASALLKAAARAIGVGKQDGDKSGLVFAAGGYSPSLEVPNYSDKRVFSKKKINQTWNNPNKKKRRKFRAETSNRYASRLNKLDTQQTDLEREVSIRQASVKQPEDFITETKDPKTNETTYSFAEGEWKKWVADMGTVREVYAALKQVVTEIIETIPKARDFANKQIAANNQNISVLRGQIHKEQRKKPTTQKNKALKAKRLASYAKQLSRQKDQLKTRKQFIGELGGRNKEAGFDFREFSQGITDIDLETGAARTSAEKEVTAQNTSSTGSGSDQLSYGQQVAAVAQEKMSVMRDYGSNIVSNVGSAIAPALATTGTSSGGSAPKMLADMSASVGSLSGSVGSTGSAAIGSLGGGSASAAAAGSFSSAGSAGPSIGPVAQSGVGGGDTNVTVVNNYETQPTDPHTWSKGMEFELGALL